MSENSVWLMSINPGGENPDANAYEFCKTPIEGYSGSLSDEEFYHKYNLKESKGIVGVGWGFSEEYDRTEINRMYKQRYDKSRMAIGLKAMVKRMSEGDYAWVKRGPEYSLCSVESDWEQVTDSEEHDIWNRNDIHHYRIATWTEDIDHSLVPGYVKRNFAVPQRPTITEAFDNSENEDGYQYVKYIHQSRPEKKIDEISLEEISATIDPGIEEQLFDLLDPLETEDLVIAYLQSNDWSVIKSSVTKSREKVECDLKKVKDGSPESGYVQVKSGGASVEPEEYEEFAKEGKVFLHQSDTSSDTPKGVEYINREDLIDFLREEENIAMLPNHTILKLDILLT